MQCIKSLRNFFIYERYSLELTSEMAQKVDAFIDDIISCTALIFKKYRVGIVDNEFRKT